MKKAPGTRLVDNATEQAIRAIKEEFLPSKVLVPPSGTTITYSIM